MSSLVRAAGNRQIPDEEAEGALKPLVVATVEASAHNHVRLPRHTRQQRPPAGEQVDLRGDAVRRGARFDACGAGGVHRHRQHARRELFGRYGILVRQPRRA